MTSTKPAAPALGAQFVVATTVAAIEDVLQGDFQLQLKPDQMASMDLAQADSQWVADNLYFQSLAVPLRSSS